MHIQLLASQTQDHAGLGWIVILLAAVILLAVGASWLHAKFQKSNHTGPYGCWPGTHGFGKVWYGPWGRNSKNDAGEE